jgi:hypothetical protein
MTISRRVGALEAEGDATERVVRWLEEAHAYGSLDAYALATLDQGPDARPLDRLPREAVVAIRARRGRQAGDVADEIRATVRAIVFRVHLVLRIHEVTTRVLEREALVRALLSAHLSMAMYATQLGDPPPLSVAKLRDLLLWRETELQALARARDVLEERYLAGHAALLPETARAWEAEVHGTRSVVAMAMRLAEPDGAPTDDEVLQLLPTDDKVEAWTRDLVEVARIKALDDTGDGPGTLTRMRAWLLGVTGSDGIAKPDRG